MKKILILALMLPMLLGKTATAYAEEESVTWYKGVVVDYAEVLTEEEVQYLQDMADIYAEMIDVDYLVLISDYTNEMDSLHFSDYVMDEAIGQGLLDENCICVFVDLYNRYDYINTTGTAIWNISDYEIECILDEAFEVPEEDYYGRLAAMISGTYKAYVENDDDYDWEGNYTGSSSIDFDGEDTLSAIFNAIPTGALFAGIFAVCCLIAHNTSNTFKSAKTAKLKWPKDTVKITGKDLIRTYTTVSAGYYKSSSSSSSSRSSSSRSRSGGSSHRSSSGRSHGGGGRRR